MAPEDSNNRNIQKQPLFSRAYLSLGIQTAWNYRDQENTERATLCLTGGVAAAEVVYCGSVYWSVNGTSRDPCD